MSCLNSLFSNAKNHKTRGNLEFELRLLLDARLNKPRFVKGGYSVNELTDNIKIFIDQLIEVKGTISRIEQSINFISNLDDSSNIIQLNYNKGVQDKSGRKFIGKKKLIAPIYVTGKGIPYKISLSDEYDVEEFSVSSCDLVRFKLRISIEPGGKLKQFAGWRIDITLVKTVDNPKNIPLIKTIKNKLFIAHTVSDLLQSGVWDYADVIEFELERLGSFTKKDLNVVDEIEKMFTTSSGYQDTIYELAKIIKPKQAHLFRTKFGLKHLGNQVIDLDRRALNSGFLETLPNQWITDKVDGERTMCYVADNKINFINRDLISYDIKQNKTTIIDCEKYGEGKKIQYYLFDVLMYEGKVLLELPFNERYSYFGKVTKLLKTFNIKEKPFSRLGKNYLSDIKSFMKRKKPYETDGYIFTPNEPYKSMSVRKWKTLDKLSIDFIIKKATSKLLGTNPYNIKKSQTLYLLFCGISRELFNSLNLLYIADYQNMFSSTNYEYFPIQFSPSDCPYAYLYYDKNPNLDGQIGEFKWNGKEWSIMRMRDDRQVEVARGNYFGNDFRVAEVIWQIYKNPITINDFDGEKDGYFKEDNSVDYKSSRAFNSFVKAQTFKLFSGSDWILDMASGKGQDLFRYGKYKIKNALFLEIDKSAIQELINRKHTMRKQNIKMGVYVLNADLSKKYQVTIEKINNARIPYPAGGFPVIMCNFAIHYFASSTEQVNNLISFVDEMLAPGGRFIYTAFDGDRIHNLLSDGDWHKRVGETLRYSIMSDYKGKLTAAGQKIKVLLPFSAGEYYDEYLVNGEFWQKQFRKKGIEREIYKSFGDYLPQFKKENTNTYNKMNDADKEFVSLYQITSYYKVSGKILKDQ